MDMQKRILLVDDDRTMSPLLKEYLEAKGFHCTLNHNAFDAMKDLQLSEFDLCILDVRMPMKNGFELAAEIKSSFPDTPFLFLSGESDKDHRIKGLEHGADDYIVKPYSMQELFLRINVILKRTDKFREKSKGSALFAIGTFQFDPGSRVIANESISFKLSTIESKLLLMFCESSDGMILRSLALSNIWDDDNSFRTRSLNVYVSKLRQYLRADPNIEILNIHGTGYKMVIREL